MRESAMQYNRSVMKDLIDMEKSEWKRLQFVAAPDKFQGELRRRGDGALLEWVGSSKYKVSALMISGPIKRKKSTD